MPSAEAALTLIDGKYQFDLILLDVHMPDSTPAAFMAQIAAVQAPRPDVIFLATDTRPQSVAALHEAGARDVIAKPFNPLTLADHLAAMGGTA